jgi:hypothetical protein
LPHPKEMDEQITKAQVPSTMKKFTRIIFVKLQNAREKRGEPKVLLRATAVT